MSDLMRMLSGPLSLCFLSEMSFGVAAGTVVAALSLKTARVVATASSKLLSGSSSVAVDVCVDVWVWFCVLVGDGGVGLCTRESCEPACVFISHC